MAFLGSLGKSLGLDSEFGKGLVGGVANTLAEGIKDDRKRTQDNIDNLVTETYKGAVSSKKEFDKIYKENKKLVENIASNMGGEQGINHPLALQAAQTLIDMKGLDGAFAEAQNYDKSFKMYGKHPTKSLLDEKAGKPSSLTLSALTKSTVPSIVIPDASALGESANVGFVKYFSGKNTGSEISSKAEALIQARGIDIDEQTIELPTALVGKIDPLILGIKENPIEEKARLLTIRANAERDGTLTTEMESNINEMIDITESITKALRTKKGLDYMALERIDGATEKTLIGMYNIPTKTNRYGVYQGANLKPKQQAILNKTKQYYVDFINKATYEGGDLQEGNKNFREIKEAMINNYSMVGTTVNGVYTLQADKTSEHLSYDERLILNPTSNPTQKVKTGKLNENNKDPVVKVGELKTSQEYIEELKKLKSQYRDLGPSRINTVAKNFVKAYMAENEGATMQQAQKVFKQLTQG